MKRDPGAFWVLGRFDGSASCSRTATRALPINITHRFKIDWPVDWNPRKVNPLGVANAPFLYETRRKAMFTPTVEF